jgi:hypothetical protein
MDFGHSPKVLGKLPFAFHSHREHNGPGIEKLRTAVSQSPDSLFSNFHDLNTRFDLNAGGLYPLQHPGAQIWLYVAPDFPKHLQDPFIRRTWGGK